MDKIKVAKELVKLAKNLIALDKEGDGSGFQMQHDYENREQDLKKLEQDRLDRAQKEGKKYILHHKEGVLWRIQACKDFINKSINIKIRKGDFGGYVESEKNLSHDGDCWFFDNAVVNQQAKVYGKAWVQDNALITDNAQVYGNAWVSDKAVVSGEAKVYGNAWVFRRAQVYGNAKVYENAQVLGDAKVFEGAHVYGKAIIGRQALIHGNAKVDYKVVKNQEITE